MTETNNPVLSTRVTKTVAKRVDKAIEKKGLWRNRSDFVSDAVKNYLKTLGF